MFRSLSQSAVSNIFLYRSCFIVFYFFLAPFYIFVAHPVHFTYFPITVLPLSHSTFPFFLTLHSSYLNPLTCDAFPFLFVFLFSLLLYFQNIHVLHLFVYHFLFYLSVSFYLSLSFLFITFFICHFLFSPLLYFQSISTSPYAYLLLFSLFPILLPS